MRKMKADVVVVGGGPGGVAAARRAAESGANVLLLEREGCLGGGATTMLVHPFMPHRTYNNGVDERPVNAGIFQEILDRLIARGAGKDGPCAHFDDEAMKVVLDEMLTEADVQVVFHAALFDAAVEAGRVQSIRLAHNSGPLEAGGAVFIDSTGDALLAELAGCNIMIGNEQGTVMPMTLNFMVAGVDTARAPSSMELRKLAAASDESLINKNVSCVTSPRPGVLHFNAIRIPRPTTLEPQDVSAAEIEGRRLTENFVAWLRAKVSGCESCYLAKTGSHIGIRESRRVRGDYLLTYQDFLRAAKFEDGIACCSYPIDIHNAQHGSTRIETMPAQQYFQIPYRCLTPSGLDNLLIAGRSISADVAAHSSIRIMPVVINIGEAAGFAAAQAAKSGDVRKVDVEGIRNKIRKAGGVVEL